MCGWYRGWCWHVWWCPRHPWPPAWARRPLPPPWAYLTDPREELRMLEGLKALLASELEGVSKRIEELKKLIQEEERK
ncbi:MAG: DUF5320 domain-containing protein [Candidatus Nezhaarchaeales archaeon]